MSHEVGLPKPSLARDWVAHPYHIEILPGSCQAVASSYQTFAWSSGKHEVHYGGVRTVVELDLSFVFALFVFPMLCRWKSSNILILSRIGSQHSLSLAAVTVPVR
jgi:hypothetical protein